MLASATAVALLVATASALALGPAGVPPTRLARCGPTAAPSLSRRALAAGGGSLLAAGLAAPIVAHAGTLSDLDIQNYPDFVKAKTHAYKDARLGSGDRAAQKGDRVVYKWEGYTIGYQGRYFQKSLGIKVSGRRCS